MAVTFVGRGIVTSNGGTIAWPVGTTAGDHGFLLLFGNGATAHTGSGWTTDVANSAFDTGPTTFWSAHSKFSLSSAEVATPFTFSNTTDGGYIVVVYRGGDGLNFKTSTTDLSGAGTTNTLTGFTKAATSDRVVSVIVNRNDSPVTIGVPTGFTNRTQGTTTFFTCDAADIASSSYTNGANVVWTALEAGGDGAGLWELTAVAAADAGRQRPVLFKLFGPRIRRGINFIIQTAAAEPPDPPPSQTPLPPPILFKLFKTRLYHVGRIVPTIVAEAELPTTPSALTIHPILFKLFGRVGRVGRGVGTLEPVDPGVVLTNKILAADAGSYALTGSAATLRRNLPLAAGAGSYALTGTAASLLHGWKLPAAAGSYVLTGTAASPLHQWRLTAGAGSYLLTGTNATLRRNLPLVAGAGAYTLTGTAASLLHGWKLAAAAGSYALTGTAASPLHGWKLSAGVGSYVLTGTDASLILASQKVLAAGVGSYLLTGADASLVISGGAPAEAPQQLMLLGAR